jgi:hypothetical protein
MQGSQPAGISQVPRTPRTHLHSQHRVPAAKALHSQGQGPLVRQQQLEAVLVCGAGCPWVMNKLARAAPGGLQGVCKACSQSRTHTHLLDLEQRVDEGHRCCPRDDGAKHHQISGVVTWQAAAAAALAMSGAKCQRVLYRPATALWRVCLASAPSYGAILSIMQVSHTHPRSRVTSHTSLYTSYAGFSTSCAAWPCTGEGLDKGALAAAAAGGAGAGLAAGAASMPAAAPLRLTMPAVLTAAWRLAPPAARAPAASVMGLPAGVDAGAGCCCR